jgi:hypothetical protein
VSTHVELPVDAGDLIYMLTKCRNILNMTGYPDEVEQINNLIDGYYITEELRRPEQVAADLDNDLPF